MDENQRREAFELVKSGQFKRDIASALEQVYGINKNLPLNAVHEMADSDDLLLQLPKTL